jgi:subtilase family serine protease
MPRLQHWFRHLTRANPTAARKAPRVSLSCEPLEDRTVPSTVAGQVQPGCTEPASNPGSAPECGFRGYTPAQIRHAYGFDRIAFGGVPGDGRGQTIAIIDAYDDPNLASDLRVFDQAFGLPDPPSFTRFAPPGIGVDPAGPGAPHGWEGEEALDVEWAHAIAPAANLVLVEASDPHHLDDAVRYAKSRPDVSVISMSYGYDDGPSTPSYYDGLYTTPAGHQGITFVESSGDDGLLHAPSAHVLIVGGTSLYLNADGSYGSETGWGYYSETEGTFVGSGGGVSGYEPLPGYQRGRVPASVPRRAAPDVAYDGDGNTGFRFFDSYDHPDDGWRVIGGTSAGTPQWAALIAIADQGRALRGEGSLDGPSQTLPTLYALGGTSAFHDITTGCNHDYCAQPGYDEVTGLGTPVADQVVAGLLRATTLPTTSPSPPVEVPLPPVRLGLTSARVGRRRRLVAWLESPDGPRVVAAPFHRPLYRSIAALLVDLDGDGIYDAVVFTARHGRRRVSRTVTL